MRCKLSFASVLIVGALFSCHCNSPEHNVSALAVAWLDPFDSTLQTFINHDSVEMTVYKSSFTAEELHGGPECESLFHTYNTNYRVIVNTDTIMLLHVKVEASNVHFVFGLDADDSLECTWFADYMALTPYDDNITVTEAFINGSVRKLILFRRSNQASLTQLCNELLFVEGVGLTRFTDGNDQVFIRK